MKMDKYILIAKWLIALVFSGAVLFFSGSLIYEIYLTRTVYANATSVSSDWAFGPEDASVTIVEYFDYRCDFCKIGHDALDEALQKHSDDVRVILKPFPVVEPGVSQAVAKFVMAASYQGRFLDLHNALLAKGLPVSKEDVKQMADIMGLDVQKMEEDAKSDAIGETIKKNIKEGMYIGITAVPAFLINDALYVGLYGKEPTAEAFDQIILSKKQ